MVNKQDHLAVQDPAKSAVLLLTVAASDLQIRSSHTWSVTHDVAVQGMTDQQQLQAGQLGPAGILHVQVCNATCPHLHKNFTLLVS